MCVMVLEPKPGYHTDTGAGKNKTQLYSLKSMVTCRVLKQSSRLELELEQSYISNMKMHCFYIEIAMEPSSQMIVYTVNTGTFNSLFNSWHLHQLFSCNTFYFHTFLRAKHSTCSFHQRQIQFHSISRGWYHQHTCRSWSCHLGWRTGRQVCHYRSRVLGHGWWWWWWLEGLLC